MCSEHSVTEVYREYLFNSIHLVATPAIWFLVGNALIILLVGIPDFYDCIWSVLGVFLGLLHYGILIGIFLCRFQYFRRSKSSTLERKGDHKEKHLFVWGKHWIIAVVLLDMVFSVRTLF